jgi:hypothetical protein
MNKQTPKKVKSMECDRDRNSQHDFFLVLTNNVELTQEVEDALFEAGCDDATLSVRSGRLILTFSRAAPTLQEAVVSAINDVRKAKVGAEVLRVDEYSLVTQAEIARRIQRTRQLVHQYITGERGPGGFPSPVCYITVSAPLWYWCEVAYWLERNDMITEHTLLEAQGIALINSVLEMEYLKTVNPTLASQLLRSLLVGQSASRA